MGIVIGTPAKHVDSSEALNHVAGYCVVHDVSERAFQLERGGQWVKGKSCDRFGPIGPWLVTPGEIDDPQDLGLWLKVNGKTYQDGTTKNMIFPIAMLISHISQFMTLNTGDIITTGTPVGVGLGQKPPKFLRDGDIVELGITGLGKQRQVLRAASGSSTL